MAIIWLYAITSQLAGMPMRRLYNKWSGEHFYTTDAAEHASLIAAGWADEGYAWYGM